MNQSPLAIALALAFSAMAPLAGCDKLSSMSEQEHVQRAKDFEDRGNLRSGIIELKNALQKNPNSVEARQLLGQIYLRARQGAEAEKELSRAQQLGANREALQPPIGEALLLMGEYKRVLDEIQVGDQTSPTNRARILQVRGNALLKLGKVKEGCELFQQSRAADATVPQTYWGLAQCAVADHDMAQARVWLNEADKLPSEQARTRMFIGDWEQLNHNPKGALAAYTSVLKIEPNNLEALQNRAVLNLKAGQINSALANIEQVEKIVPNTAPAYYLRALFNFQQQKYVATRDALQEVFKTAPGHLPSSLLAGATAFELGSYEQAEKYLQRYLSRYPHQAYATRILAATQVKQNHPSKALETLAPLLVPDSRDVQAMIIAGEARQSMQDSVKAAEWFARAATIDPKNASLQVQMGLNHLSAGDIPNGLSNLESAAALDPKQPEADNILALAYLEQKQYDKALSAIEAMDRKLPGNPAVQVLRGQAYAGKSDFVRARESFEKAHQLDPGFFPAVASLAQLDIRDKNFSAARQRLENVRSKDKNQLQANLALAQMDMLEKNTPAAISKLEKATLDYPSALEPRQQLVALYLESQQFQKALTVATEAWQTNPDNPIALDLLGTAQLGAGQKGNALTSATRLVEKMPHAAAAYLKLAQVNLSLNNPDAARSALNQALHLQPDFPLAQETLVNLEIQVGHTAEALRLARQMQTQHPRDDNGFLLEGRAHIAAKKPAEAAQAFTRALALDRKNTTLIQWHGAAYSRDRATTVDQPLIEWLKVRPADFAVRAYLAQHYMNTGRMREAIAQYETILQYQVNNALALNNLAALYQQQKDPRALATAEKAYKFSPKNAATQDTLGWILVDQGKAERGLSLIKAALAQQPEISTLRYHYAVALLRTGAKNEARAELMQTLKQMPTFPEAPLAKALLDSLN